MNSDISTHYQNSFPDGYWPEPVPNASFPKKVVSDDPNKAFTYTFCWHGAAPFLLWHRALMAEFERNLQKFDPKSPGLHEGAEALGVPYWPWETWDGQTLPFQVTATYYTVKTDAFCTNGFPKGSVFLNPFHRWFAPVSVDDQIKENFPEVLTDSNCTLRAQAYSDRSLTFDFQWPVAPSVKGNLDVASTVSQAISNPSWTTFSTTGSTETEKEKADWVWEVGA